MRRISCVLFSILLLLSAGAQAKMEMLELESDSSLGDKPVISLLEERNNVLTITFQLPTLGVEALEVGNELYHALSIPGAVNRGADGQASLPSINKLIALPDGASAIITSISSSEKNFAGYRVFPVQPDEGSEFSVDRAYYSGRDRSEVPLVELGEPAIMRDLRVLPLRFNPVAFDPVSGELKVAERIEIEIDMSGTDRSALAPTKRSIITESFDRLYRDTVINYRSEDAQVGPGTYLAICLDNSAVTSRIEPLLDWRRRQGYNVILETFSGTASNSAIKSVIQSIYNTVEPPLEFVTLFGDAGGSYDIPCWYESSSGYYGEGDHYYTTLEGGDVLADVALGRISFRDTGTLDGIINKILAYETNPPTSDSGWFTRATLAGDPSASGISCIFVNQWLKRQLINMGYNDIDTIWSGDFVSQVVTSVNQGVSVMGYRGYWGMSDINSSHISYLSNGNELPFAIIPTCDTGSFASDDNCRSEAFLRNGGGGGIGAIGTATIGTHTRYNNCFFLGTWEGAVNGSDHRLGIAQLRGKLELYANYNGYESSRVDIWSMWNSLMGDPATDMWLAYPAALTVDYPASIPTGVGSVPVNVRQGAAALEGALVCAYKDGEVSSSAYTDVFGNVDLPVSGFSNGTMLVTVTKHNHMPHLGSLTVGSVSNYPAYAASTIDDDTSGGSAGNGNGELNPGETIELPVQLRNFGSSAVSNVSAVISSSDPYVTIIDGSEYYGTIAAGASDWCDEDFDLSIADNTPDGHIVGLDITATNGGSEWTSLIELTVHSADFDYESFAWAGGSTLDPGESGSFTVTLRNNGSRSAVGATALLSTSSPWISVTDNTGSLGTVASGATGSAGFALSISSDCFEGHLASFQLIATYGDGENCLVEFDLPVGTASSNDPVGPDGYGYYAFDNTDTGYPYAPIYSWIEIDPNYGGSGVAVPNLNDGYYEGDDVEVVSLPFNFNYYGESYDEFSICSNGFIAMGVTPIKSYRNWSIPGAGNPDAVIAVFWDNLVESGGNQVYHWYDSENDRYIVQWSRMRNYHDSSTQDTQNVQVILLDPSVYATPTGDGEILMQYHTIDNSDYRDGYCSVGIQNPMAFDGVLYTYANNYAPGAAGLISGRAIRFLPVGSLNIGTLEGDVMNASNGNSPLAGITIRVVEANQTLISAGDGHYSGGVSEGLYTVRAEHESFLTVTVNDVSIVEDEVTIQDFALTDILGPYIENVTVLGYTSDTVGPYLVQFNAMDFSDIDELHMYYKVNGGGQFTAALTLIDAGTGLYEGEIPGYGHSTSISYWIEAEDGVGNASREPAGADEYYEFWILNQLVNFDDDMESDTGWTVSGDASTGIWTRVNPIGVFDGGREVQPEDDASSDGTLCWITGNAETGNQGVDDVDGGSTILTSPVFDLEDGVNAQLSYRRWYTNDTGSSPSEDYWVVEVNDGSGWIDLENTNASDRSWSLHSYLLDGIIDLTTTVQFRFTASDLGSGSVVEAGVDEFLLSAWQEPTATAAGDGEVPAKLTLMQNSPNPFNPETRINFGLPSAQKVDLRVYDASGRLVKTLLNGSKLDAGFQNITWNGRDDQNSPVASGIYFYRLSTERETLSSKMTLLK